MLIGEESATEEHVAAIRAAPVGDGVSSVIHLRTMHLGRDELLITAKIEVSATETAEEIARAIAAPRHACERRSRSPGRSTSNRT